jgi:ferredoxin
VLIAPDYFDVDEAGLGRVLIAEVAADCADLADAERSCPEGAIVLTD